jgi:hypothetical protein
MASLFIGARETRSSSILKLGDTCYKCDEVISDISDTTYVVSFDRYINNYRYKSICEDCLGYSYFSIKSAIACYKTPEFDNQKEMFEYMFDSLYHLDHQYGSFGNFICLLKCSTILSKHLHWVGQSRLLEVFLKRMNEGYCIQTMAYQDIKDQLPKIFFRDVCVIYHVLIRRGLPKDVIKIIMRMVGGVKES